MAVTTDRGKNLPPIRYKANDPARKHMSKAQAIAANEAAAEKRRAQAKFDAEYDAKMAAKKSGAEEQPAGEAAPAAETKPKRTRRKKAE